MHRPILLAVLSMLLSAASAGAQTLPASSPVDERETLLSDTVQLTRGFARAGEAYFSPDMKWIIFQASDAADEPYQMYVAKLKWDGERITGIDAPIRISPEKSRNTCGSFSPDGKSLIFASTVGKERPDAPGGGYNRQGRSYVWSFPEGMEIFRCDGWQAKLTGDAVNLARTPLTDNDVYDAECAFSPDGKWICFTRGAGKDADIFVMRPGGSDVVKVVAAPGYDGGAFFSPDGRRLVYRSDRKGNDLLQLYVCDLAFDEFDSIVGMNPHGERQLTNDENVNWGPYWHPDGRHIIFATSRHGHSNYELYLIDADGSHATRVTHRDGADVLPVFSPDGNWLLWTSKRTSDQTTQVFVARFKLP
jgi:Tol biopolymer transport system component